MTCVLQQRESVWCVMLVCYSKIRLVCNDSCVTCVLQQNGTVRSSEKCYIQQLEDNLCRFQGQWRPSLWTVSIHTHTHTYTYTHTYSLSRFVTCWQIKALNAHVEFNVVTVTTASWPCLGLLSVPMVVQKAHVQRGMWCGLDWNRLSVTL